MRNKISEISDFRRGVVESVALLGCYAAWVGRHAQELLKMVTDLLKRRWATTNLRRATSQKRECLKNKLRRRFDVLIPTLLCSILLECISVSLGKHLPTFRRIGVSCASNSWWKLLRNLVLFPEEITWWYKQVMASHLDKYYRLQLCCCYKNSSCHLGLSTLCF